MIATILGTIIDIFGKCLGYPILILAYLLAYVNTALIYLGAWLIGAEVVEIHD